MCHRCGSDNLTPFTCKPPVRTGKGKHECTEACTKHGSLCLNCRLFNEAAGQR